MSLPFVCVCGARCSSRDNLVTHVRFEALYARRDKFRQLHILFAAALPVLFP